MNLYNHYGRFSKRACKIIIELWKEGADLGFVTLANGKTFPADITWYGKYFELAGFIYMDNLRAPYAREQDIVKIEKLDLVAKRYRETYQKPANWAIYYTVQIEDCCVPQQRTWTNSEQDFEKLHNGFVFNTYDECKAFCNMINRKAGLR